MICRDQHGSQWAVFCSQFVGISVLFMKILYKSVVACLKKVSQIFLRHNQLDNFADLILQIRYTCTYIILNDVWYTESGK